MLCVAVEASRDKNSDKHGTYIFYCVSQHRVAFKDKVLHIFSKLHTQIQELYAQNASHFLLN